MIGNQKIKAAGVLLAWLAAIVFGLQSSAFVAHGQLGKYAANLTLALGASALAIHLRTEFEEDN
jgi:hypothetical protein